MGAAVQPKTYFPGSMTDLNKSFYNGDWNQYRDDKSQKISGPGNGQHYDYFLMTQAMDGYSGYGKEQIRQTILKHESVFKHQLQELHRLYKRQRDLMNPVPAETSNLGRYLSQLPSDISKGTHIFASSVPLVDSSFDNPFSPIGLMKGKSTLNHFGPLSSKNGFSERRVIDLELSEVDTSNYRKQRAFNLADLNEPVQVEERETAFSVFFSNKNGNKYLAEEPQKRDSFAKRTLFGVEISESKQTPSFLLPWKNTTSVQNPSTFHHNNVWLHSSDLTNQNQGFFADHSRLTTSSTRQNSSAGFAFPNGINSKDSLFNSREENYAQKKHTFLDMWKNQNRDTPQQTLPSWLTAKPCLQNEQIKLKETPVHHFNLNSQNQSQQFFKKTEMTEGNDTHDFKKLKINNTQTVTKILGVQIIDKQVESHCEAKGIGHHIDLNLSLDEEDSPPSFPESVVKIATMEIDLEAPAVESDSDSGSMDNTRMEIVKIAAEAIVSISISQPPCKPSSDTLMWFAEIITCNNLENSSKAVSEDLDYFEYMTLKLEDTKESYDSYKAIIVEEEEQKEDDSGSVSKRTARKGQGRRGRLRKDFQKDILPSIVSLSRREVTEDLQIFEEFFSTTGVSWQSSLSKRKAAARNGRGKRRLVVPDTPCNPPTPPVVVATAGGEKSICREMSLEKSLGGWGRRTRRLPRQRCQNGGNHNQSLALKC